MKVLTRQTTKYRRPYKAPKGWFVIKEVMKSDS